MDFPIVTALLSNEPRGKNGQFPSERQSFLTHVKTLADGVAGGSVGNQTGFTDLTTAINRAIEHAWSVIADRHVNAGKYETLPREVLDYWREFNLYPTLHLMGSFLKRSVTTLDHPLCRETRAFLLELMPLADLYKQVKATPSMIAKRQPKAAEERKPGFNPPKASTEAQKIVVQTLTEITEQAYAELRERLHMSFVTALDFVAARMKEYPRLEAIARHFGRTLTAEEYFYHCQWPANMLWSGVIREAVMADGKRRGNWAAIVDVKATRFADDIRNKFVHKNFRKIASVIDAKGNYQGARVLSREISLNGLTGTIGFTFADGSSFVVRNAVVHVVNSYHTYFRRFPLTFHNVVMPDGSRMRLPSQARMNRVFVGKKS